MNFMRYSFLQVDAKKLMRISLFLLLLGVSVLSSSNGAGAAGSVVISNVRINDLTTGYADIGWNTNLPSDSIIEWGVIGGGLPNQVAASDLVTTHQLRLEPLAADTVYEYRVGSKLDSEAESDRAWFPDSGTITFSTPSGGGGGSDEGPRLTNIQVNANCCSGTFTFSTNEPSAYKITITDGPNAVGNSSTSAPGNFLNDWSVAYPADFVNNIPLLASSSYEYRIELTDPEGNYRSYGPLPFRTGLNQFDYVFTPGVCAEDNTPLGQCNEDGFYCGPGGLVINCEVCGFQCQVGETCRNGGACTTDPGLGNDSYQCNPPSCYGRACVNSGSACSTDADCPGSSCQEGVFLSPAGPGCYASWNQCNANTVVQVDRDRVCNKWMTCRTQTQVTNPTTQTTENLCYDLAACAAIGPNGECAKPLFGKYCVGDALRFCSTGNDCESGLCKPASGTYCAVPRRPSPTEPYEYVPCDVNEGGTNNPTCLPFDSNGKCTEFQPENVTYVSPIDVQKIKYLSGSVKAGLRWNTGVSFTYDGQFPWYFMPQDGSVVSLGNEAFENQESTTITSSNGTQQTVIDYTTSPWSAYGRRGSDNSEATITVVPEDGTGQSNPNHILKIDPTDAGSYCRGGVNDGNACSGDVDCGGVADSCVEEFSGAQAPSSPFSTLNGAKYIISFKIRSSVPEGQTIQARIMSPNGSVSELWRGEVTTSWQGIVANPVPVKGGSGWLQFVRLSDNSDPFYIDDVSLNVALGVSKTNNAEQLNYVPRSCRLYPSEDSLLCQYRDDSGVRYKGWYGYCLEKDPKFADRCISWWPVDIIGGETDVYGTFGSEIQAGYSDRSPLYYCVEAEGVTGGDELDHDGDENDVPVSEVSDGWRLLRSTMQGYESENGKCNTMRLWYGIASKGLLGGCDDKDFFGDTDGDCEWSGCDGKADYSVFHFDDSNNDPAHFQWDPADEYYKNEIIQICIDEKATTHSDWHIGRFCLNDDNNWKARREPGGGNFFEIEVVFNTTTGRLDAFKLWGNDKSGDYGGFEANVSVQLRETCNKIVKVVDENGQNKAWASRLSIGSGYTIRDINYVLTQDLAPYGGAVTSAGDPSTWTEKLYVEQPRTNENFTFPYQSRAGSPFACKGDCSSRVCIGGGSTEGAICHTADDCRDNSGNQGVCAGVGVCSISQKACQGNFSESGTCLAPDGTTLTADKCCSLDNASDICIGGAASIRTSQVYNTDDEYQCEKSGAWCGCNSPTDCSNVNGDTLCESYQDGDTCKAIAPASIFKRAFAINNLQRIFSESYGFWTWSQKQGKYIAQEGAEDWSPPTKQCLVCNTSPQKACDQLGTTSQCGGATCNLISVRGTYNTTVPAADYCGVRPRTYNFSVNDQQSADVSDGSWVNFKFNSTADSEQLPLDSLLIDWSDGQQQSVYFPYAPKSDAGNPHNLSHRYFCSPTTLENLPTCNSDPKLRTYPCAGPTGGEKQYCVYQPRVVVKDNWGWCNGVPADFQEGSACPCADGQFCHPQYNICVDNDYLNLSCESSDINFPPSWQDYAPNKTIEVHVQPIGT